MTASTGLSEGLSQTCINLIRTLSMDAVQKANLDIPALPWACAGGLRSLDSLDLEAQPRKKSLLAGPDRFTSGGHASMLLYSLLI